MLIGQVAEHSGVSARMLRHYDKIGLVSPSARTHGGYRHYTEDDLRQLFHVEGLRSLGLSLREIAAVLRGAEFTATVMIEELIERTRERIAHEQELLRTLGQIRATTPDSWAEVLDTVALMRGLNSSSPSSRQRLALSLAQVSARDAVVLAEAALTEPNPTVAGTLYWALARAGDSAVPILEDALASPDSDRRQRAVFALEKINTLGSREVLACALGHADQRVQDRAAIAGGTLGQAAVIPTLVSMIVSARDDVQAADTLGLLAADHSCAGRVDEAMEIALAGSGTAARLRLTSALSQIPGELARTRLAGLASDADQHVARAARYALSHPS
jgi:DNA-binding transcriptional MerR regulator